MRDLEFAELFRNQAMVWEWTAGGDNSFWKSHGGFPNYVFLALKLWELEKKAEENYWGIPFIFKNYKVEACKNGWKGKNSDLEGIE